MLTIGLPFQILASLRALQLVSSAAPDVRPTETVSDTDCSSSIPHSIDFKLAQSYFDLRNYRQCYEILSRSPITEQSDSEKFLRLYSLYLVCIVSPFVPLYVLRLEINSLRVTGTFQSRTPSSPHQNPLTLRFILFMYILLHSLKQQQIPIYFSCLRFLHLIQSSAFLSYSLHHIPL